MELKNYVILFITIVGTGVTMCWTRDYPAPSRVEAAQEPQTQTSLTAEPVYTQSVDKQLMQTTSDRRIISYEVLTVPYVVEATEQDIDALMRLVEAEAGGEDATGKLLVANVVLNRVRDSHFPDTIYEVIYQKNSKVTQFSPVASGRIDTVTVSGETREAVQRALRGEDVSKGALYFMARSAASSDSVCWFDNNLTLLFSYGGHDFFL